MQRKLPSLPWWWSACAEVTEPWKQAGRFGQPGIGSDIWKISQVEFSRPLLLMCQRPGINWLTPHQQGNINWIRKWWSPDKRTMCCDTSDQPPLRRGTRCHMLPLSPVAQVVKNLPAVREPQETQVRSLGQEVTLEEGMATHSSILAWRIPWTEEPDGIRAMVHSVAESDMTKAT